MEENDVDILLTKLSSGRKSAVRVVHEPRVEDFNARSCNFFFDP